MTQIKLSVEGETWTEHPDGWSVQDQPQTRVATVMTNGRVDRSRRVDAEELLLSVARLVPEGTRLRVTVETIPKD